MHGRQAGFTLIELIVTVAVIGILAAVALPSFFSETRKSRAFSEVQPLFNDLRVRLEQYLQENGRYPPAPAGGEDALQPNDTPGAKLALGAPAAWALLKLRTSGTDQVVCRYAWVTGRAADAIGTQAGFFGFVKPQTDWYYVLAKCDMDSSGAVGSGSGSGPNDGFSWYFTSSTNSEIQRRNEGQ